MKISATLLCDSATVREGLLHVLGGGVTRIWRPSVPAPLTVTLAAVIEMPRKDLGKLHEVHVVVKSPTRQIAEAMGAVQADTPPRMEIGESLLVPFVMNLQSVGTPDFGAHDLTLSINNGQVQSQVRFWVLPEDERNLPDI